MGVKDLIGLDGFLSGKKQIPALTMSGGRLKKGEQVYEYRVWVHPKTGGDDFFYDAKTYFEIMYKYHAAKKDPRWRHVEKPLAVVWDEKYQKFRETIIPAGYKG